MSTVENAVVKVTVDINTLDGLIAGLTAVREAIPEPTQIRVVASKYYADTYHLEILKSVTVLNGAIEFTEL